MEPEEIKDRKSLEAWLDALPEAIRPLSAVTLAQRSAHRVFPLLGEALSERWALEHRLNALPSLRVLLAACVAISLILEKPALRRILPQTLLYSSRML